MNIKSFAYGDKFEKLFGNIQTAESAIRGYVSTGNPRFTINFQLLIDSIRINSRKLKEFHDRDRSTVNYIHFR